MFSLEKFTSSRQRIIGLASKVSDKEADEYFNSRSYGSKIGAWASDQSSILKKEKIYISQLKNIKKNFQMKIKFLDQNIGLDGELNQEIEFWLDGENRIHERLKYIKKKNFWEKILLNP